MIDPSPCAAPGDRPSSPFPAPAATALAQSRQIPNSRLDDLEMREIRGDRPPNREAVRVLVIGSRSGVMTIIQTLIHLGFAEMAEWSPFLPGPNPGEVMRILTRHIASSQSSQP